MATQFDAWLVGEDEEHLAAVADAIWEEVDRIERLLSRFDPASEISRINRLGAREPVLVDREVFEILQTCRQYWRRTAGYYDITARTDTTGQPLAVSRDSDLVLLDSDQRTVRFHASDVHIDLGGFGKGYVLDLAAELLRRFCINSAMLHGGTSSVLAKGANQHGQPWRVGVRDPFADMATSEIELTQVELFDQGLSCSAVYSPGTAQSDIIDPHTGQTLAEQAACFVIAPTALEAEILSTACLSMGLARAHRYIEKESPAGVRVGWVKRPKLTSQVLWLTQ